MRGIVNGQYFERIWYLKKQTNKEITCGIHALLLKWKFLLVKFFFPSSIKLWWGLHKSARNTYLTNLTHIQQPLSAIEQTNLSV